MATDRISLRGLEVFAYHGVYDREQADGQTFLIDIDVWMDLSAAGSDDDLSETLDYGRLAGAVHQRVAEERWNLVERVAQRVSDLVLEDHRVLRTEVTVHKPDAPIPLRFQDVSVTIVRGR